MTCNACNRTIYDKLMSKTSPDNKIWHSECLKCSECNKLLDSKYFETSGRLYCRNDYLAYFGPSCFGCAGKITDDQYFFSIKQTMSTGDTLHGTTTQTTNTLFFHDRCFSCSYCSRALQKGDKYCIIDGSSRAQMIVGQQAQNQQKSLMICHEICAMKYYSGTNQGINNGNIYQQGPNNTMHGQQIATNSPTPRAKRGRMKQNRPG